MHYLRLFTDRDVEPIKPTIRYFQPLIGKPDISRITDYINFYKNHRNIEGNVEEIVKLVSERKSYKFIDYHFNHLYNQNKNNPFKLNVPSNFNTKIIKGLISNLYNLEVVSIPKNELPKCLIDLKTIINSRTVLDIEDLDLKINSFNKNSLESLFKVTGSNPETFSELLHCINFY